VTIFFDSGFSMPLVGTIAASKCRGPGGTFLIRRIGPLPVRTKRINPVESMNKPCWITVAVFALGFFAGAAEIDFNREIRPILSDKCFSCHGPDAETRDADYRLDVEADAKRDLGGYFGLLPGKAEDSEVWLRITHEDPDERMPPAKFKKTLTAEEKDTLRRWIDAGAPYAKHWAYEKPVKVEPQIDAKARGWTRNEIDAFVWMKLNENGLAPSGEADPRTLMRRVSLDLIGLPPSPEQVEDFLQAWEKDAEAAYQGWIDALMQSPRFGERWARPWLDLARYADSNGFQADQLRDSWAYRDWVIEALNANMPYDQFTIEQLAGDLLPNASIDQKIATGFHRTVTCNVEAGVHPEENRVNQVIDRVNTTGTVWLGTTMECAQCHDHKYDPITMEDYYSTFAYFNNTPVEVRNPSGKGVSFDFYGPKMDLPMNPKQAAERKRLLAEQATVQKALEVLKKSAGKNRPAALAKWRSRLEAEVEWQFTRIAKIESTGGESFDTQGDDSTVLVLGQVPDTTTYTATVKVPGGKVGAIRVDALTDNQLPGGGPGRGDPVRRNFILSECRVAAAGKPLAFSEARASFSQVKWDVAKAIDGNPKTGWAISPQFGKPHWAAFTLTEPLETREGDELTVVLDQFYGSGRTIGKLRIMVAERDPGAVVIPPEIRKLLTRKEKDLKPKELQKIDSFLASRNPEVKKREAELAEIKAALKEIEPDTTLVMVEREEPRETHVMTRGNYLTPAARVEARPPETLHPIDPKLPANRLGYARWLMDRENPLVARVTVNRWWNEIFGRGLVTTIEDFGSQGEPPTHPALLDWLAVEFMESGWDMQQVLRKIVTSSTYRQSSRVTETLLEKDPENRFYARGPRFRMTAEMIRDHGLVVSGLLSTRMGGAPIMPYQPPGMWRQVGRNEPKWVDAKDENRFRRGIYVVYRRAAPYPSFVNFDAPDRGACVVKRGRTNTPLQALTLLNDPAYIEMALALADRILTETPTEDFDARLARAFELVVQREPSSAEREHLRGVLEERKASLDAGKAKEILADPAKIVSPQFQGSDEELAAWFNLANILLNLDETITKS